MRRIMIVDDSPRIIEAFENACKDHYQVISTTEGEKALELIPLVPRDILIWLFVSRCR